VRVGDACFYVLFPDFAKPIKPYADLAVEVLEEMQEGTALEGHTIGHRVLHRYRYYNLLYGSRGKARVLSKAIQNAMSKSEKLVSVSTMVGKKVRVRYQIGSKKKYVPPSQLARQAAAKAARASGGGSVPKSALASAPTTAMKMVRSTAEAFAAPSKAVLEMMEKEARQMKRAKLAEVNKGNKKRTRKKPSGGSDAGNVQASSPPQATTSESQPSSSSPLHWGIPIPPVDTL
jgi:hypothetical protein